MEMSGELLQLIKDTSKDIRVGQRMSSITQRKSNQWNFDIEFDMSIPLNTRLSDFSVKIFARQNTLDQKNFSCGIQIVQDGKKTTLSRYNGSNHKNAVANYEFHIHHATTGSINRGDRNPEHEDTQVTDRYIDLDGAFKCLCDDYKIRTPKDLQSNLFGGNYYEQRRFSKRTLSAALHRYPTGRA